MSLTLDKSHGISQGLGYNPFCRYSSAGVIWLPFWIRSSCFDWSMLRGLRNLLELHVLPKLESFTAVLFLVLPKNPDYIRWDQCYITELQVCILGIDLFLFYWSIVELQWCVISGVQQSDSVTHIQTFFFYSFPLWFIIGYWI